MAEKKQNINPEQFNEFLTYVATKVEPTQIEDIFTGKAFKETIDMFKEDNPLIKSYQLTGAGFINKLLEDKTDFNLTNDDKKLIIEVGAFGDPDPRSGFKFNMSNPKIADRVEKMSEDLVKQKQNLSNDEYEIYRANARKKLVNDVLKFKVTDTVFDNKAPKLDVSERDRSKPFSDFITKELNMQSRYGFNPEIPDFAGGTIGKEYIPANNQERYRTKTITSEYFPDETTTRDRLENCYPDKESGYLRGPEGLFFNPETEKFLRQKDVYGPAPELQGYQYDPRLKEILSTAVNPNYGSQFKKGGKTMDIKQQTKNVAAQGRYGDSMLLHVNPAEVKGLASAMPITVNPQTGQPEAFLPFLAPLIGSALGTSFLATTLGSKALAAGIGAGLATYAQTGGSGSKALLSGLTAGFGTNAANTAAQGAETAAATQANIAAGMSPEIASTTAQQAALNAPRAATGTFDALGDAFMSGPDGAFNFDRGASALASAAGSPSGMLAGTAAGMRGIIESQEAFERQIGESEEAYRRRREQNLLDNPEPILYSAEGGRTGYYEGGRFGEIPDNITGGNLPQIFAPAKQAYDVNPDFMAGFAPETMYFNPATISAPASGLQAGAPPIGIDTYQGSKGGYGGRQASIAPQTSIDPYTAYTGSAPKGLEFTEAPMPEPIQPMPVLPITPPDFGIGVPNIGGIVGIPNIGNIDIQSIIDGLGDYNRPERFMPMTGEDLGITQPRTLGEQLPKGVDNNIDISNYLSNKEDTLGTAKDIFGPQVEFATSPVEGSNYMMTAAALEDMGITPQPVSGGGLGGLFGGLTPQEPIVSEVINEIPPSFEIPINPVIPTLENITAPSLDIPVMQEIMPTNLGMIPPPISNLESLETRKIGRPSFRDTIRGRAEGGDTLKPIPKDNKGLPNLPKDVRNEMGYMQAGGMTDIQNDPLTQEVTMFILGETDNEQALNDFISKYGSDTFMQLREAVLQSIVPNAQTEGLIRGDGEGGMDDDLRGMIGGKERIAVSQDEFIVPADVVSMLGDGSSDAGSKELYDMMDRVRKEKTGTTKQAPKLANAGGLLPA